MKTIVSGKRHRYLAAISILLIFSVTVALTAGMVGCGGGEEEEEEEEFTIEDWYDLNSVRDKLGADYVWTLEDDLDSDTPGWNETASPTANGGKGWKPIGAEGDPFKGTFDGGGHTISDLYIYRPDEDEVGLFGRVQGSDQGGVIENLGLVNVNVTGREFVGALVGYSWKGTLDSYTRPPDSQTYSRGSVAGEEHVGGLVGDNYGGTVNQCESSADVLVCVAPGEKRHNAGGLVGLNSGLVLNCECSGGVNGDLRVGGLVGMNERVPLLQVGVVEDCCSRAYSVNGTNTGGGFVGLNLGIVRRCDRPEGDTGHLTVQCFAALNEGATGNADSSDTALPGSYFGGFVGVNEEEGIVEECSTGVGTTVVGVQGVGGFVGWNLGTVTGCSSSGEVTGSDDVGGFAGYNTGTVSYPESTSCVTGAINCGPLVGRDDGTVILDDLISIPLKNPGSFVQMTIGEVESLDPAWGYDSTSGEQVQYIYETLLFYDGGETDQFVPVLATEWELLPDGVTYRFKVREGVRFHEGGDLTPEDVEYSFERAMVQDRVGGPAWMLYRPLLGTWSSDEVTFADIDNAVEVDGDSVVFRLSEPAWGLAFLQILCSPWASIVDKEWCIANGDWDGTGATWQNYNYPEKTDSYLYDHTNGTGPWKLNLWEPGIQIRLVRNDDYWGGPAPFDYVITQIVEEWTTRKLALLAGDADLVYVPRAYRGELEGFDLNVYQDLPVLSIDVLFFDFNIASGSDYIGNGVLDGNGIPTDFFSDLDVRKGFCYAFGYETFIEDVLLGEGRQVGSPIVEGFPFYNPGASMYSFDLDKAEEHLRAAWGGQVWDKGFKFTLLYNTGNVARETACWILAENLAAINPLFNVNVQSIDWASYLSGIVYGRLPMFQLSWIADYPHPDAIVVPFMHSTGALADFQGYGYPALDGLIEDAFKELDPAVQEDMYYQIQERYYEDAPGIILYQPLGRRYFTEHIHGFYYNPLINGAAGPLYHMSKSS